MTEPEGDKEKEAQAKEDELVEDWTKHAGRPVVSLSEAAKLLGVHNNTIRQYYYEGKLPGQRLNASKKSRIHFSIRDLVRFYLEEKEAS